MRCVSVMIIVPNAGAKSTRYVDPKNNVQIKVALSSFCSAPPRHSRPTEYLNPVSERPLGTNHTRNTVSSRGGGVVNATDSKSVPFGGKGSNPFHDGVS